MTVDQLLQAARARLKRLEPLTAYRASMAGARMIDIRSEGQLAQDGIIPGALIIPRNVVEWRLDPAGPYRHPGAPQPSDWTIVVCHEGYQSSLVAATLRDMGFDNATDLIGGFCAWRAAELPVLEWDEEQSAAVAEMEARIKGSAGLAIASSLGSPDS